MSACGQMTEEQKKWADVLRLRGSQPRQLTEEMLPKNWFRRAIVRVTSSVSFDEAVLVIILANIVILAMDYRCLSSHLRIRTFSFQCFANHPRLGWHAFIFIMPTCTLGWFQTNQKVLTKFVAIIMPTFSCQAGLCQTLAYSPLLTHASSALPSAGSLT